MYTSQRDGLTLSARHLVVSVKVAIKVTRVAQKRGRAEGELPKTTPRHSKHDGVLASLEAVAGTELHASLVIIAKVDTS